MLESALTSLLSSLAQEQGRDVVAVLPLSKGFPTWAAFVVLGIGIGFCYASWRNSVPQVQHRRMKESVRPPKKTRKKYGKIESSNPTNLVDSDPSEVLSTVEYEI